MLVQETPYRTVWMEGAAVKMIDQRRLPHVFSILACPTMRETVEAITNMTVRGAGAIGAAAGYAMAQAVLAIPEARWGNGMEEAAQTIRASRPTARDLFYAVERVLEAARTLDTLTQARAAAVLMANRVADENARAGEAIGRRGAALLRQGMRLMTHCNAGWLAFVDWGSALAPLYWAKRQGIEVSVAVMETRPRSQGAKLTAWELSQEGISHTVFADTAAGSLFARRQIHLVIVGADRIAANRDAANKIGPYTLAVLAKHHGVPFYVAAPRSTFDLSTPDGSRIPIEARAQEEVTTVSGVTAAGTYESVRITPEGSTAANHAFDVTSAALVTAFVTEEGLIQPEPGAIRRYLEPRDHAGIVERTV